MKMELNVILNYSMLQFLKIETRGFRTPKCWTQDQIKGTLINNLKFKFGPKFFFKSRTGQQ